MKNLAYPVSCLSINCGDFGETCKTCRHYPALKAYKQLQARLKTAPQDHTVCTPGYGGKTFR